MAEDKYIAASCVISNKIVYKNEKPLFENKEVAGIADFLIAAYHHFGIKYPKFYKMDSLSKLGWLAAEVLLKDSFEATKYKSEDIGIVLSNASSSLDTDIKYFESVKEIASPALFVYTLPNIMIGEISIRHNFKGENAFFIFEKFDPNFIEQYVTNLFNRDILQACICGWVELLGEEYKAALFLIEKGAIEQSIKFTTGNINKIYQL